MTVNANPYIVTSGQVVCLDPGNPRSYSGSGTNWIDASGGGYNATITNGPSYSTDNGGIFNLDGVDDYFVLNQINSSTISVSMWLYLNAYPAGNTFKYYVPIRQGYSPVNYSIYIDDYVLKSYMESSSGVSQYVSSNQTMPTSVWFNLTGIWNWTSNTITFYKDGTSIYSGSFSAGPYTFNNTSQGYNFTDISRNVINNNSFVSGKIGPITIYNKVLTLAEVQQNFNAYRGRYGI